MTQYNLDFDSMETAANDILKRVQQLRRTDFPAGDSREDEQRFEAMRTYAIKQWDAIESDHQVLVKQLNDGVKRTGELAGIANDGGMTFVYIEMNGTPALVVERTTDAAEELYHKLVNVPEDAKGLVNVLDADTAFGLVPQAHDFNFFKVNPSLYLLNNHQK